jgi:hypothetical protein
LGREDGLGDGEEDAAAEELEEDYYAVADADVVLGEDGEDCN